MKNLMTGHYRDVCHDAQGHPLWDSGWQNNLVVQSCNLLLAALMKREASFSGILYWAIGVGDPEWDSRIPSPVFTDTQLRNEVTRVPLHMSQIVYLDDDLETTETITNRLEITVSLEANALGFEGTQPLREFGLFGGDADVEANSGFMIDYVIHPRYDLAPGSTLTRRLHLTFATSTLPQDGLTGFGAMLPVISIDGVGRRFAAALNAVGVNTLNDLLRRDPLSPIRRIPGVKLREFRAKARLVLGFRADLTPFMSLAQMSLSDLLKADPAELSVAIGSADVVTVESVSRIQEDLAFLQVALDDSVLQEINLAALLNT